MSELILIVEDEPKLAQLMQQHLEFRGYNTHILSTGLGVVNWVKEHSVDLILLDLMLPGQDGLSICRDVRQFSTVPIIMVTARVDEIDRLLGLELGADDCICKPFSAREVVARVKAVLRRVDQSQNLSREGVYVHRNIEVDLGRFECRVDGAEVLLTPVEFRLLAALMKAAGKVMSRNQLMDVSYEDQRVVSERTVDSHIKNLRKKIHDLNEEDEIIQSIYGIGYRLS